MNDSDDEYILDLGNITLGTYDTITLDLTNVGGTQDMQTTSYPDIISISGLDDITIDYPYSGGIFADAQSNTLDNITLTGGGEEMLRISKEGFYVKGIKVEADEKEAKRVYEAFKQWMTWAVLSRPEDE